MSENLPGWIIFGWELYLTDFLNWNNTGEIFLGGKYSGWEFSRREFSKWELSSEWEFSGWDLSRVRIFPGGNFLCGNCPVGIILLALFWVGVFLVQLITVLMKIWIQIEDCFRQLKTCFEWSSCKARILYFISYIWYCSNLILSWPQTRLLRNLILKILAFYLSLFG